jgi:hypothetical protein
VPEVLRIGRQIAEGLAAAHATDLIHRDIKPGNVLLEGGQHKVKITDFGLARTADDASISQSGIIAGTPMYMAPEQALGQTLDQRADLFSLGSVLYQMVAGRPPFRANTAVAVLKRVAEDTPRAIREVIPETPQWLCDIIAKLHAKDPDERFQSAREVAAVLADCEGQLKANSKLKDFSRIPRSKQPAAGKSGWWKWVAGAVLLLPALTLALTESLGVTHLLRSQREFGQIQPGDELAPVQAAKQETPDAAGWVQLFNGKDLTGWKTHPDQPGNWRVGDGVLIGSDKASHLFTERGDYANFHLRVEAMINPKGDSGVFFRSAFGFNPDNPQKINPLGYEAQIVDIPCDLNTGTLFWSTPLMKVTESPTEADKWFTLEVVADGRRLATRVNGKPTAYLVDDHEGRPTKGHIALQVFHSFTVVKFRKIEIKELPANPPGAASPLADPAEVPRKAADVLPFMAGMWKVEKVEVEPKPPAGQEQAVGHMICDYVAGGKFLRQRGAFASGTVEPALQAPLKAGSDMPLILYAYNGKDELAYWGAWPNGMAHGPVLGRFDPGGRSLLWLKTFPGGIQSTFQFNFVDPNTIATRLYNQDPGGKILQETHLTFTRVKEPVTLPNKPTDPKRPDEMKVLDRLVGEWRNEVTVTDSAAPDKPKAQTARAKAAAVLGGRFVETIVTCEPDGHNDYSLAWFDPAAKRYRQWLFNGTGGYVVEPTGTWDEAANTLTWTSPDGRLEGRWVFKSDDVREFRHIIKTADGKVVNEAAGVSRRTASAAVAPLTDADVRRIAPLPAEQQVEEVRKELVRRNPGFDGQVEHKIEDGVVTNKPNGLLADLTPLEGMNLAGLKHLDPDTTRVTDAGLAHFKDCKDLCHAPDRVQRRLGI